MTFKARKYGSHSASCKQLTPHLLLLRNSRCGFMFEFRHKGTCSVCKACARYEKPWNFTMSPCIYTYLRHMYYCEVSCLQTNKSEIQT